MWLHRADGDEVLAVISAPEGTPLRHALGAMAEAIGCPGPARASIDDAPVPDSAVLGSPPLVHGARIRLDDAGADASSCPDAPRSEAPDAAAREGVEGCFLRVLAGPGAGGQHHLAPGSYALGRGDDGHVRFPDARISRRHALLRVGAREATVVDLGSSNGTFLDGARLGADPAVVGRGARVRMGHTIWSLAPAAGSAPPPARPTGTGGLLVNRAPRAVPTDRCVRLQRPRPPEVPPPGSLPLLTLLLPPAVALLAAVVLRQPAFLLFGLMGPAMSLGAYWTDRRSHGRRRERALRDYTEAVARHESRLAENVAVARRELERHSPALAEAVRACCGRTAQLWQRHPGDPDWLRVRIGQGRADLDVVVVDPDGGEERPCLPELPTVVQLAKAGVTGMAPVGRACGDHAAVRSLAWTILAQCLAWHGPAQLHVWVLTARSVDQAGWRWLTQAPHVTADGSGDCAAFARVGSLDGRGDATRRVKELTAILEERRHQRAAVGEPGPPLPWHLVVLDGARELIGYPGTAGLLRQGPEVGIVGLCLGSSAPDLPAECATVILTGQDGITYVRGQSHEGSATADLADAQALQAMGRALAPLVDGTPALRDTLPQQVSLCEMLDVDPRVRGALVEAWRRQGADTTIDVGCDAAGPVRLDLRVDGPHALVGGTTGSGKSELLRTLITSLAARNRPDRLCFVLIDYKGGSAFDACARLPHTVGVVTDLDGAAAERALTGLRAELRRREELLRAAGVSDLEGYERSVEAGGCDSAGVPLGHLPRLVLVVDEFRALAEELPEFVAGVVRFAALGRSLGVHLVLATQRPAGIVSADIRANVGLRIALRVRDASDSVDVVESPAAASLPVRCPGRAVVRSGGGPLITFQTARLAARRSAPREVAVRLIPDDLLGAALDDVPATVRSPLPDPEGRPTAQDDFDLDDLVRITRDAAATLQVAPPTPPWLPPLPERILWRELAAESPSTAATYRAAERRSPSMHPLTPRTARPCDTALHPVILLDDPEHQCRRLWTWAPDAGHLALVGRGRSGRTQSLRVLATAVADAECPSRLALHVVDAGGGQQALTDLPHAASYVTLGDPGALRRLVRGLRDRVRTRATGQRSSSRAATGDDVDPGGATTETDEGLPTDLLVIDGWDQVRALLEGLDHGAVAEELIEAARGGAGSGLRILAAGGRGLLTGAFASCFADRLVLDLSDPTDVLLAGLRTQDGGGRPPGRAVLASSGLVGQIALLDPQPDEPSARLPADVVAPIALRHAHCAPPGWGIRPLPARLTLEELREGHEGHPARNDEHTAWLGVRGDGGALLVPLTGPGWLIAGPPGSGRTTALRTIAAQAVQAGRPTLWCSAQRPPALDDHGSDLPWCGPLAAAEAERHLLIPGAVVLVDDLDDCRGSALDTLLSEYADSLAPGACIVATGRTADLANSFRGLPGTLRRTGQGLVLGSAGRSDELFALALPRGEPDVPGRGTWVRDGRAETVQVAVL